MINQEFKTRIELSSYFTFSNSSMTDESYGKIKHLEEENKILKNKLNDHEKHVIRLRRQASSSGLW